METRREESKILVENFSSLADVGVESGGSATFEWPRFCSGWDEVEELTDMLTKHSMFSTYPTGSAFGLTIKGLKPLKPWRIITTHERLALELDSRRRCHPKGYCHDRFRQVSCQQPGLSWLLPTFGSEVPPEPPQVQWLQSR